MAEISFNDKKEEKKLFFYDYIGIGLVIVSIFFFIQVISFLSGGNFVAAIIGTLIGSLIFTAGINMIKISAISKITREDARKNE